MMKFRSLKILTDENISPRVVSFLRQKGTDVIDTKEEKWHGKDDEYLLEKAFSDNRFILTHDSDFGTLAIKEGKNYYGIVYLRIKIPKVINVIRVIDKLLSLDTELYEGNIIVVDDARIRIRLPESER
jgi:predicted nuclease of predicted toxin-antitoxin system